MRQFKWFWKCERRRFLLIGAYNTCFSYTAFAILYFWLHGMFHYLIITVVAHCVSVGNGFLAHRMLVFQAKGEIAKQFARFSLTHAGTLIMGLSGMALLVERLGLPPLTAQGITLSFTACTSYIAHKHFTFRRIK